MANTPQGQTPRQLRRQQQREANLLRAAEPQSALPMTPPSEFLGPSVLVPVFCAMIVMGYLLFQTKGFAVLAGNELSKHQAVFTAVNAATLTGFQQARNPDNYTPAGQYLTLLLMIGGTLFSFIGSGVAILRIARLPFKDFHLLLWAIGSVLIVMIFGGLAMLGDGRSTFQATFQAISAFSNCGLTLGMVPTESATHSLLVLMPLALLGGLGLPVLMDIVNRISGRGMLSQHSRSVLAWTAGVYLCITIVLFLLNWPGRYASASLWRSTFIEASQLSLNARSAGFPFSGISGLPQATTFILILAMIIGASPGGTGGGLKVTTLDSLARGTLETLTGRSAGRRFGVAILWALLYLAVLGISTTALLMTEPDLKLERSLFLAASALGNVGLSHDPVVVSTLGLHVLSATMILGRVAPMMMLWYILDTTSDARVAVG